MFIWTLSDAIGVIFWGLVLLAFIGVMIWIGLGKLWRGIRARFSARIEH